MFKVNSSNVCVCVFWSAKTFSVTFFSFLHDDVGLQFNQVAMSWINALTYCSSQGSSLVEITNHTVWGTVKQLLQNETGLETGVWIGLERSIFGSDVPWQWISGTVLNDTEWWNSSFPVNMLNNHCGKIIWVNETQKFKWLDGYCHDELPFICQGKLLFCLRPNLTWDCYQILSFFLFQWYQFKQRYITWKLFILSNADSRDVLFTVCSVSLISAGPW